VKMCEAVHGRVRAKNLPGEPSPTGTHYTPFPPRVKRFRPAGAKTAPALEA